MRRLVLAVALFCVGAFCLAQSDAQVPLTGAGLGTPHVSSGSFSLTYEANGGSADTSSANQTYGSLTWGSGCTYLVNGILWYNTANSTVSSKSDNSAAGIQVASAYATVGAGETSVDVWDVTSPSGTSGTVAVDYTAAPSYNSSVFVYCLISSHPSPGTAVATNGGSVISLSVTVAVPSGGAAIACVATQAGHTVTWTNATEDAHYVGGGAYQACAHTTTTGSVTITAAFTSDSAVLAAVPFGP